MYYFRVFFSGFQVIKFRILSITMLWIKFSEKKIGSYYEIWFMYFYNLHKVPSTE